MELRNESLRTKIVRWDITGRCNLRCLHCYNKSTQGPDLTTSAVIRILRILSKNGLRELNLSGREPTMRQDLPQIISWCHQHHVKVNLTTNGTLLNQTRLARFISSVNMIVYSIDGAQISTHDSIRGSGSFWRTTANIKKCRNYIDRHQLKTRLGVSCTIHRRNIKEVSEIVDLCSAYSVDFLAINAIAFFGSASRMKEMLYLSPEEIINAWEKICRRHLRVRPAHDLHLGTFPMEARLLNAKYDLDLPVIQNSCSAGKSLYINQSGEAFPCYMIPPIAAAFPEFNKYMKPWRILTEPISKAKKYFGSFIKMAHAHTQIDHQLCTDCSERADCRPCPLVAMYDGDSLIRCRIAERATRQLIADIDGSTIPAIRSCIRWNVSDSILRTYLRKGDYTSERKYQLASVMKCIWGQIDGIRTIQDISGTVLGKFPSFGHRQIVKCVIDFVKYFRKEGVVRVKHKDR